MPIYRLHYLRTLPQTVDFFVKFMLQSYQGANSDRRKNKNSLS